MTKKLDELKKQEQKYQELAAQWDRSSKTERDRQQFLDATEGWNELHDEISQLEQELHGQQPYRKLIKIH
jgi:thymidylate kinase